MAITKTFSIFGINSSNIYNDTDYTNLQERKNGFQPNTLANSKLANTAIMANSKFVSGLIDIVNNSGSGQLSLTIGPNSSAEDINSFLNAGFGYLINDKVKLLVTKTTTNNVDSFSFSVGNGAQSQVYNITNIKAQSSKTSESATTAVNVSTNINGKPISNIFESDGTTAKLATISTNAENTSFTNASNISISLSSAGMPVDALVDGATYQVYIEYDNVDLTISPTVTDEYRLNLGTFRFTSSRDNYIGSCFANLLNTGLVYAIVSSNKSLNVYLANSSFQSTALLDRYVSSRRYTRYNVIFRRIK